MFKKATKHEAHLRLALAGPSGSGKTYTALNIAKHLGSKIALIDTERGSASKYADVFAFDVMELETFHPQQYINAIHDAEQGGYDVLIIDSYSHAWNGKNGALELVDQAAKRSQSQNSYVAWREVTPLHNALVDAMLQTPLHLIVTMRSKMAYSQEKDNAGKTVIRKLGLEPIQRDGVEYEFDVFGELNHDNELMIHKSRCTPLTNAIIAKAGAEIADTLKAWLAGEPAPPLPERPLRLEPQTEIPPHHAPAPSAVISERQVGFLMQTSKQFNVPENVLIDYLESLGIHSRKDILKQDFDGILNWVKAAAKSQAA